MLIKKMLLEFNEFIIDSLKEYFTDKSVSDNYNFQRSFDKFRHYCGIVPHKIFESTRTNGKYDEVQWDAYWQELNKSTDKIQSLKYQKDISSIVVPLFHGVPFMKSQYTNYQRREVFKKISVINRKLLGKFNGTMTKEEYALTSKEKVLIGIHSRTSTATNGMQSLYEIMVASDADLDKLDATDETLSKYFTRKDNSPLPKKFKIFMKDYVFNFSESPVEEFWENVIDGYSSIKNIVKYRFPVIATSKAPDHAIRFAIGQSVEGARGETPMQPEYIKDGHPTHRLAGLVYVTLHELSDLVSERDNRTMIDINQSLKLGEINKGRGAVRFNNQLECDFLGKIDCDKIVAVIPIIYPNINEEHFEEYYHQAIYGLSPDAKSTTVVSPTKIKKDIDKNPNPIIMNERRNIIGFGKMLLPSIIDLINGVIVAIAKKKEWFLCSVNDSNELLPYKVGFDKQGLQFSKAQQNLTPDESPVIINRFWQYAARLKPEEENPIEGFSQLKLSECDA
jgi:hypothetical protein